MAMVNIGCPIDGCQFATGEMLESLAAVLLSTHAISHSQPAVSNVACQMGPKLERPKIEIGISLEQWNMFERRCHVFQNGSGITPQSVPAQLFQCAGTG